MGEVLTRRAADDELGQIIELAGAALGWRSGEPNETLFRWKHLDNPFGRSPMWVAEIDGRLAGFRTFLRWEWLAADGRVRRAVRAVDTATHPDFQGRGVFRALTTAALVELDHEGVDFVFNTPNDQSRPGYLKMGWQIVGRPQVKVRAAGPVALVRMARARVPAQKWSLATEVGEEPAAVFAHPLAEQLIAMRSGPQTGLRTNTSPDFYRWRYGLDELRYRVLVHPAGLADGFVVFRLRSRGDAVEVVVADVVTPAGSASDERALLRSLVREVDADYLIRLQPGWWPAAGFVPLPGQGPILTWRAVRETTMVPLEGWHLVLGDVELF